MRLRQPGSVVGLSSFLALACLCASAPVHADPFEDLLVQPPSIGQPQRGSLAGSLSRLAYGAADLARGAFELPLPVEVPEGRGKPLVTIFPSYSSESGQSEWGMGWSSELSIRRHRIVGDLAYNDTDGYTSPWGRLVKGDDGAYYLAGLRTSMRFEQLDGGWRATAADGTRYIFAAADAVTPLPGKTYAWMLSRVESVLGERTLFTWVANDTGRRFLARVSWGGRGDDTQHIAVFEYETLAKAFPSYATNSRQVLDRRVKTIQLQTRSATAPAGAPAQERWRYVLGYTQSPNGPAFYLTSLVRRFPGGAEDPPATYTYDLGDTQLANARLREVPALSAYLGANGTQAISPTRATMTDVEQNGLTDLEQAFSNSMVKLVDGRWIIEPLPATPGTNPLCRPAPSSLNQPRLLARMRPNSVEPEVVVVKRDGVAFTSTLTICTRLGVTRKTIALDKVWTLGPTVRLADVDLDQRPDFVRVGTGTVQVLRNTSPNNGWSFETLAQQTLQVPTGLVAPTPSAAWILDENGDGKPDLLVRSASDLWAWSGTGNGKFDPMGRRMPLRTLDPSQPLQGLNTYQLSHGDVNGDGLSDLLLSKDRTVYVFVNQGDAFAQVRVPGLENIGFTFNFPLFADLAGTGNPEVVFTEGTTARSIALATPRTGLLRRADDGKGTVIDLDYDRTKPEPGIIHRYALLSSLVATVAGRGTARHEYSYARPVWHSVGRFLVGFGETRHLSPLSTEVVSFLNDDDVSGVVSGSVLQDEATPTIDRFTANTYELFQTHGVPWRRQRNAVKGVRHRDGSAPLTTEVDFEEFGRDRCPVRTSTVLPDAVLIQEDTLASVSAIPDAVHCLPATRTLSGLHGDPSLDFSYAVTLQRNERGQVTSVTQDGPDGPRTLQEIVYDEAGRPRQIGSPGRGTTTMQYDALGRPLQITAVDGSVIRVSAIDPVTDALAGLVEDRNGGAALSSGFAYDGRERLERRWQSWNGSSRERPAESFGYRYADASHPGLLTTHALLDEVTGQGRDDAELIAADGETIGRARFGGNWLVRELAQTEAAHRGRYTYEHGPLVGASALADATFDTLYGVDAEMQSAVQEAAFGYELTHHRLVQRDVVDSTQTSWSLRGDELVVTAVQAGMFVREVGQDAAGRVVRTRDELGFEQHYRYDALGRLVAAVTPDGEQRVEFDGYGQPRRVVRDGLAAITYSYSPISGLPVTEDVAGSDGLFDHGTSTERDATGRPVHIEQTRADGAVQDLWFDYDGVGAVNGDAVASGQRGRLSRVRGLDFDRRTLFDPAGHIARQSTRLAGGWRELIEEPHVFADGSPAGRRLTVLDGQGATLWQSDESVRLDGYGQVAAVLIDGVPLYTVHRDGEGRLERADFVDGQVLSVERDPLTRRMTGYRLEGANLTVAARWNRDQRGLVSDEQLTQGGTTRTSVFGYDARRTLRSATGDLGASSYDYSASGLPTTMEDALGARDVHHVTAGTSSIAGVVHRWDALGRLVQRGTTVMSYGADGQVVSVRSGLREATYAYDEAGQRVLKRVDGQPERAFVAGGVLTAASFTVPVRIEGILVGVLENGHWRPLAADARGTPFVTAEGAFDAPSAYGVRTLRATRDEVIDYAGMPYDADLGAVRMGVRDYDPYLGQFLTADPLFLSSLDKCRESPIECGLFGYARANPLAFVDPEGKEARTIGIDELVATFVKYADTFQVGNASVFLGLLARDYGKDAIIRVEVPTQRGDRCFEKPETKVFTMPVTPPKEGPAIREAPKGDPIRTPLSERVTADLSGLRASPLSTGLYVAGLQRGMTREELSVGIALGNDLWSLLDGVNSLRQNEHSAPDAADDRERTDRGQQR